MRGSGGCLGSLATGSARTGAKRSEIHQESEVCVSQHCFLVANESGRERKKRCEDRRGNRMQSASFELFGGAPFFMSC